MPRTPKGFYTLDSWFMFSNHSEVGVYLVIDQMSKKRGHSGGTVGQNLPSSSFAFDPFASARTAGRGPEPAQTSVAGHLDHR